MILRFEFKAFGFSIYYLCLKFLQPKCFRRDSMVSLTDFFVLITNLLKIMANWWVGSSLVFFFFLKTLDCTMSTSIIMLRSSEFNLNLKNGARFIIIEVKFWLINPFFHVFRRNAFSMSNHKLDVENSIPMTDM